MRGQGGPVAPKDCTFVEQIMGNQRGGQESQMHVSHRSLWLWGRLKEEEAWAAELWWGNRREGGIDGPGGGGRMEDASLAPWSLAEAVEVGSTVGE